MQFNQPFLNIKRENRAVSNADWKLKFPEAHVVVLPRTHSDHNPILIDSADYFYNFRQNRPFRYVDSKD